MPDKKTDEMIKQIKDQECCWPDCEQKNMMTCSLPFVKDVDGKLEVQQDVQLTAPFCKDHFMYGMSGYFSVLERNGVKQIYGPFDVFRMAEIVYETKQVKEGKCPHHTKEEQDSNTESSTTSKTKPQSKAEK